MMNAIQKHSGSLRLTTFLLVLVFAAASTERDDNVDFSGDNSGDPDFSALCDRSGLYVTVTFSRPFKGIVFANGHASDSSCSLPVELATSEISMPLPLTACGTRVQEFPGDGFFVTNTIAVKHQDEMYVYDYGTVTCKFGDRFNSRWLEYPPVGQTFVSDFTRPIADRRFVQRLGEESTERSIKQREARNSFLKATIKALAMKLMKNKRRPRIDLKESGFEKRLSSPSEDSSSIGTTIVQTQTETTLVLNETSTVEVTSMFPNIQVHVINMTDYDYIDNYDATEDTGKFNYGNSFIQRLADTDPAELEHSLSEFANFSTIKNLLHAASTVVSVEKPTGNSIGRRSMVELTMASNGTSNNADNFDKTVVSTVSTVSDDLGEDHGNCVPRMRFTVMTIVLVFVVVSLLLVCCGMALYIRKEKKKRLIDNFLLYNFY